MNLVKLFLAKSQSFVQKRQAFIEAPTFHYFDADCHICIETDVSSYSISGILNQLTLDNLG